MSYGSDFLVRMYEIAQEKDPGDVLNDLRAGGFSIDEVDAMTPSDAWESWAYLQLEQSEPDPDSQGE
jgi:hypothetical protein